jgi:hypothetical protein
MNTTASRECVNPGLAATTRLAVHPAGVARLMTRSLGLVVALAMLALPAQAWAKPKTTQVTNRPFSITKHYDKASPVLFMRTNPPQGGPTTPTTGTAPHSPTSHAMGGRH